jgi:hypothetical protein
LNNIAINFLELTPHQFDVTFFKKRIDLISGEEQVKYKKINFKDNENKTEKYVISFSEINGFQSEIIPSQ